MRVLWPFITCLAVGPAALVYGSATVSSIPGTTGFVHVQGPRLISPAGTDFTVRSMGVGSLQREALERDYAEIAAMKLNSITLTLDYRDFHATVHPAKYGDLAWRRLNQHLAFARKYRLYVILQMCGIEGAQFIPLKGSTFDYRIWVEPDLQNRFLNLWQEIAKRYRDETQIIGYGIFCEPVTAGTRKQWIDLANRTVSRIRSIDKNHVLFIERVYGEFGTRRELSGIDFDPERAFFLVEDSNVVYQFYFFERDEYTHQQAPWREDRDRPLPYPDPSFEILYREALNDRGRIFHWDHEYLDFYLSRQLEFGRRHSVPMFVWAFGLMNTCFHDKGGLQWLSDVKTLFQQHNLSWSYSDYRDADFGISDSSEAKATLSGAPDAESSSQPDAPALNITKTQWHHDLQFLAAELPKRHKNAFHYTSKKRFAEAVTNLDHDIERYNPDETYTGIQRLVSMIGDGHTFLEYVGQDTDFPIRLRRFGDDYRVIAVDKQYLEVLGLRLTKIGQTTFDRAHDLAFPLTPQDETKGLAESGVANILTSGIALHGLGITPDRFQVTYTFEDAGDRELHVNMHATPGQKPTWVYPFETSPLYMENPDQGFWFKYLPEFRTVYCNFKSYDNLEMHAHELLDFIAKRSPQKLAIDLRQNGGGNFDHGLKFLVRPIRELKRLNQKGHLFVLIGPNTFSAAMSNATHFRYQTRAILLGEPIGERPNSYQEIKDFSLPNSHLKVHYSTEYYKFVNTKENVVRPDKEIVPDWNDYVEGRDPVLEWALKYPETINK